MANAKLHQVFVGCPFRKNIRQNYDRLKKDLEAETPLAVILADTGEMTSTNYLLQHISKLIADSAACIFDATGGNPNVSLEVGIAHALPADYLLTISTRKPRTKAERTAEKEAVHEGEVKAIISDLQGKNRIEYKAYRGLRSGIEKRYLAALPFMKRWAQFKGDQRDMAPYALKLFEQIRLSGRSQRPRLVAILDGSGFTPTRVVDALVWAKLLVAKRGRQGGYFYPSK
jgi:hypothetical protein